MGDSGIECPLVYYDGDRDSWRIVRDGDPRDYDEVVMGLSFGVPEDLELRLHSVAVAGRRLDGTVDVLDGFTGAWDDLLTELVNKKDFWFARKCYVDDPENALMRDVRQLDGLTHYKLTREPLTNREVFVKPLTAWRFFRNEKHVCSFPSASWVSENWPACLVTMEGALFRNKVTVPRFDWPDIRRFLRRPWQKAGMRSSIFRALSLAALPLLRSFHPVAAIPDAPIAYSGG